MAGESILHQKNHPAKLGFSAENEPTRQTSVLFMEDKKDGRLEFVTGSLAMLLFRRTFLFASAIFLVTLVRVLSGFDLEFLATSKACVVDMNSPNPTNTTASAGAYLFQSRHVGAAWSFPDIERCKEDANLTANVVAELMHKKLLDYTAKALCVGDGYKLAVSEMKHLGFASVSGVEKRRLFSLNLKRRKGKKPHQLSYPNSSFDFVFSKSEAPILALLVLEVERVLKRGGIGAMLVTVGATAPHPSSVAAVSSLLRTSTVIDEGKVKDLDLVVFKKTTENTSRIYHYIFGLPANCSSLARTKGLVEQMEPVTKELEKDAVYFPEFVDVSKKTRLIFVDIGELFKSNVTSWFPPSYPVNQKAFDVYFVDHNTSTLSFHVEKPGIAFVSHPGQSEKKATVQQQPNDHVDLAPPSGGEVCNLLDWFKGTVRYAEFVVLKMNGGTVELKFLSDLIESGAICFVDELFLSCLDNRDGGAGGTSEDCMDLLKGLRSSRVFVHEW